VYIRPPTRQLLLLLLPLLVLLLPPAAAAAAAAAVPGLSLTDDLAALSTPAVPARVAEAHDAAGVALLGGLAGQIHTKNK
jgi:hypothetical protein